MDILVFIARHPVLEFINLMHSKSDDEDHISPKFTKNNLIETKYTSELFSDVVVGESVKFPSFFRFDYCELLALSNNSTNSEDFDHIVNKWSLKLGLPLFKTKELDMGGMELQDTLEIDSELDLELEMEDESKSTTSKILDRLPEVTLEMMSLPDTGMTLKRLGYVDYNKLLGLFHNVKNECDSDHVSIFPSPRLTRQSQRKDMSIQSDHLSIPEVQLTMEFSHFLPPEFVE